MLCSFFINVLGGVWIRFCFGCPIQALFVIFPAGGYVVCTYLLYLTLAIFYEQLCWGRKLPDSRWSTLADTICMLGTYVGIGLGFMMV